MKHRILVVEDEPDLLRLLVDVLARAGAEVHAAHSGHEALELLSRLEFTKLLTDVNLPDMNAVDLLKRLPAGSNPPGLWVMGGRLREERSRF